MVRSNYRRNVLFLFSLLAIFAAFGLSYSIEATQAQEGGLYYSEPLSFGASLGTDFVDGSPGAVSEENDAGLFLSPEVARGDRRLGAYSADKVQSNKALVPGLAGIATHVLREQVTDTKKDYSLADAMADALWRKQVVDSLYRDPGSEDNLQ